MVEGVMIWIKIQAEDTVAELVTVVDVSRDAQFWKYRYDDTMGILPKRMDLVRVDRSRKCETMADDWERGRPLSDWGSRWTYTSPWARQ